MLTLSMSMRIITFPLFHDSCHQQEQVNVSNIIINTLQEPFFGSSTCSPLDSDPHETDSKTLKR